MEQHTQPNPVTVQPPMQPPVTRRDCIFCPVPSGIVMLPFAGAGAVSTHKPPPVVLAPARQSASARLHTAGRSGRPPAVELLAAAQLADQEPSTPASSRNCENNLFDAQPMAQTITAIAQLLLLHVHRHVAPPYPPPHPPWACWEARGASSYTSTHPANIADHRGQNHARHPKSTCSFKFFQLSQIASAPFAPSTLPPVRLGPPRQLVTSFVLL